jgi:hypothetical protein
VTVHFISVGLSLLTVMRDARTAPQLGTDPDLRRALHQAQPHRLLETAGVLTAPTPGAATDHQAREKARDWFAAALNPPGDPAARERITELCERIKPGQWPSIVSAELSTFTNVPPSSRSLSPGDTAVLIASDTPDGLVAALWNAVALTGGDLDRVRYLDGVTAPSTDLAGRAVIARVPGMDAGTKKGFAEAMRGLGTLGRHLLATVARQPLNFYLSGGYKAAIPYLIGLAEAMRGVPDAGPVRAYVLHETAHVTGDTPIELPLRALTRDWVRRELGGFDSSGRSDSQPPGPGLLRGYAYEEAGGHWELTAFGAGMAALFGLPQEGIRR